MLRAVQKFAGVSLLSASCGMWLIPMEAAGITAILCKIMVTLIMAFVGAALWQAGAPVRKPEVEVDLIRREVRLVRPTRAGGKVLSRCKFSDLGKGGVSTEGCKLESSYLQREKREKSHK